MKTLRWSLACLTACVLTSGATSAKSLTPPTPPSWCSGTLSDIRTSILNAERYPANNRDNAFKRYGYLNGPSLMKQQNFDQYESREIGAIVGTECGQGAEARLNLYDLWAQVLDDQADSVFFPETSGCRPRSNALIRVVIANDASALAELVVQVTPRDRDVSHIYQILRDWAGQHGARLPPVTDRNGLRRLAESYSRDYEQHFFSIRC